jgi:hypothetical protein
MLNTQQETDRPEIARFYGIVIKLFIGDHPPSHFHAVYGECVGLFNIDTLEMIEGDLPSRAKKLVIEWELRGRLTHFQQKIHQTLW